jgi:ribosomal protein S18 acetylase RimI-like enzyme
VSEVVQLEGAIAGAWPALELVEDETWLLRASQGLSRRANSVLARPGGTGALDARIERAEAFYRERGLRPHFHVSQASPRGLDDALARRSYTLEALTSVLLAPAAAAGAAQHPVELAPEPSPEWLRLWQESEGYGARLPVASAILDGIELPKVFALARVDGEAAAMARAVADGRYVGIYAVATHPRFRRRGLAGACVTALASWGAAEGAATTYLLVERDNAPASALYAKLGFSERFAYWYRAGV